MVLIATVKPESRTRRNSKSDAASGSQVKLQDAYLGGLMDKATEKLVATEEESGDLDLSEPETWSFHEEEVTVICCLQNSYWETRSIQQIRKLGKSKSWEKGVATQSAHASSRSASHGNSLVDRQKIYEREPADPMEDLDVNAAIWAYSWKPSPIQCFVCDPIASCYGILRILTSRNWIASTVCRRSLSGKCSQDSRRWTSSKRFKNFLWKIYSVNLEHFNDRIIFMSMYDDIERTMWIQFKDNCGLCSQIPSRTLVFLGTWIRKEMVRDLFW